VARKICTPAHCAGGTLRTEGLWMMAPILRIKKMTGASSAKIRLACW